MPALPPALVRPGLRAFGRWAGSPRADWPQRRRRTALGLRLPGAPRGVAVGERVLGGVPCEELRPADDAGDLTVLYIHGGGCCVASARAYRGMTGRLADHLRSPVVAVDYRLAPEHPHPAQRDDVLAAWDGLTREVDPATVVVAGDSAGGGLAILLALALRDAGRPLPGVLGLICPWVDAREQQRPAAPREPLLSNGLMNAFARAYAGPSVLFADLRGLPPCVVQTGADDLLSPTDGLPLVRELRRAGVRVEHQHLDGLWHVPHLTAHLLGSAMFVRLAAGIRALASAP